MSGTTLLTRPVLVLTCLWALAGHANTPEAAPPASGQAAASAFDVWEYRVRGNTLLPMPEVERTVYPFLGPGRSVADVQQAREALERAYRDAGYVTVFVDLPEQEVSSGVVLLTVTEGRIGRVSVKGSRYFSNGWIRSQLPEVQPGQVPKLPEFQQQLATANSRSADRTLTPLLRPGSQPGTVDLDLQVRDELPLHGGLEVNNNNSVDTSDLRLNASLRYDNLWQRDHSFGLLYQVAPEEPSESSVWVATYAFKPERSDKTFAIYGLKSDSDVATVGGDINVIGKGTIIGGRMSMPLAGTESLYHSLSLGVDYKDFEQAVGFEEDGEESIQTPVRYANWSLAWNGTLPGERLTQSLNVALNLGFRGLVNDAQEFADKRYSASAGYLFLTGGYAVDATVWRGTSLAFAVSGQISPEPLIDNEQFAAGGNTSVRGYFAAEILGDYGLQTSLEWRSPAAWAAWLSGLDSLYGFVFTDVGTVGLHEALPDQDSSFSIWSTGLGLRLSGFGVLAALDWAWPLKDGPSTEAGEDRVLFSASYGF